ncbi:MAG: 3-deoxy-D-manno-octulosonic acid transferase [Deltaproteobacteria bacterium]|nr:3-deoxy-D-manno-octulosonic acid transferase [Deltaproteobacteria bacterium]
MDKYLLYLIYFIASLKAGLLGWPYFWWHLRSRGQGESFAERLGLKLANGSPSEGTPRIWLHGVSVGEILSAPPLLRELKNLFPDASFIVTTGTETGQAQARRHLEPLGAYVCYFPLDVPWAVQRYLNHLKPDIFIALESELWPNFLISAHRRGVRLALLNARLSDKSFRRFSLFKRYVIEIYQLFDAIAAGSRRDYDRLRCLGLGEGKVHLTGNLKIERLLARQAETQPGAPLPSQAVSVVKDSETSDVQAKIGGQDGSVSSAMREKLNLDGQPVFLAASTHPGEDEAVLAAYEQLRTPCPALVLLLAPRHPERAGELEKLIRQKGLACQRWHRLKAGTERRAQPVVIIDTIGDLMNLYSVADLAFVGGSLVPHGGQNILEPAAWGVAPLYGPHLSNFRWAQEILEEARAGIMVRDAESLSVEAKTLLDNPALRREMGARARASLLPHQGAARRQAELIGGLFGQRSPTHA